MGGGQYEVRVAEWGGGGQYEVSVAEWGGAV